MKLSVSIPHEDVEFLDEYAKAHELPSRSAAVRRAIQVLRVGDLTEAYGDAWDEWEGSGEAQAWEPTVGDGL